MNRKLSCSAGRKPNTEDIGLKQVCFADGRGIFKRMKRCARTPMGLWSATLQENSNWHVATAQGRWRRTPSGAGGVRYGAVPSCVYTSPEIAAVGLTEEQARGRARYASARSRYLQREEHDPRPSARNGKILSDSVTGELLGAHPYLPTS